MRRDRPVPSRLPAGVAAGHPATVEAGMEILEAGGSAADAAVAASLASCVAETVMTGLLGGGHALYFEHGRPDRVRMLDFFVAVPGLEARSGTAEMQQLAVPFGVEIVHYAVGIASCGVPGVPAGLQLLWEEHGRLPWQRLVEPALRLARSGVPMPPAHVACLEMLAPVMTMREGERVYAPRGRLLRPGEELRQPGLVAALETVASEGADSFYRGTLADALLALMEERGGRVTFTDLERYRPRVEDASSARFGRFTLFSRAALNSPLDVFEHFGPRPSSSAERTVRLVSALAADERRGDTTNITVAAPDGDVCVLTTSLGLGSGDWLPGYDLHLNSMLGEADLLTGELEPGARMASMMAPTVVVDEDGSVRLAIGAAGGSRLRSALVQVALGVLEDGLSALEAVERPRLHPAGAIVNVEPGCTDEALAAVAAAGYEVRAWPDRHHYFGGVSLITPSGAAGDPRRSGGGRVLP